MTEEQALSLESQTKYFWWLGRGLADALKRCDTRKIEDFTEDLDTLAEISDHPTLRTAARSVLCRSRLIGAGELVAFEVVKTVVAGAEAVEPATPARKVLPAALLSLVVAACASVMPIDDVMVVALDAPLYEQTDLCAL